jgi:hypothetical protein
MVQEAKEMLLTAEQAATALTNGSVKVTMEQIKRWSTMGRLPTYAGDPGQSRYLVADVIHAKMKASRSPSVIQQLRNLCAAIEVDP